VQAVFDRAPMIASQREQPFRRGLGAVQRHHAVGHFHTCRSVNGSLAANLTDLADVRPVEVRVEPRAAGECAAFDAAVTLLDGAGRLLRLLMLALFVGGKRPPRWRPVPA
jgi:hypothetical protein